MGQVSGSKYMVQAGWDDVPHLTERTKAELLAATMPYLRDARSKGIPSLGSGAIYPVPYETLIVPPFQIPHFWPRAYALDVGWGRTAALWGAKDPNTDVIYGYSEHYRGEELPAVHAQAIKARGDWIQGAIDPAARNRTQADGERLMATYTDLGLHLTPAINEVEAGIYEVWSRLESGRLKFFSTLVGVPAEYRLYRRDERGKIVKKNDHLMDVTRYLCMTWQKVASVKLNEVDMTNVVTIADKRAGY